MTTLFTGFLSGALAGALMGIISHICFRRGLFKSSLIIVDGSFFFRTLNVKANIAGIFWVGFTIHLVTSGVFGAIYGVATDLLGLNPLSLPLLGLYIFFLWLSMLFIALPVAGEGILGSKSGPLTCVEQFVLHLIFFIFYYIALKGLS